MKRYKFCVILFFQYCINNGEGYLNPYIAIIVSVILAIILASIVFKDLIWENAHRYYFAVCMIVGTITIVTLPAAVGITADDEIHYSYVENLSWGAKDKVAATAAVNAVSVYSDFIQNGEMYGYEARSEWEDYLNQLDEQLPVMESVPAEVAGGRNITITSVAYIPGAIGLIIGRGIGLSYTSTFRLGKWMNLFCYVSLFSIAIKMTKGRGKTLISVIGLIPTNFFMRSTPQNLDFYAVQRSNRQQVTLFLHTICRWCSQCWKPFSGKATYSKISCLYARRSRHVLKYRLIDS